MDDKEAEIPLFEEELRQITRYAATCARQALSLFEAVYPLDSRPKDAIAAQVAYAASHATAS